MKLDRRSSNRMLTQSPHDDNEIERRYDGDRRLKTRNPIYV